MNTKEQIFNFVDKTKWPRGEWDSEPDKVLWIDESTGYDCMIHRGTSGALCGYVGVPVTNKHHGKDYDSVMIEADGCEDYPEVHGGLTFSSACQEQAENGRGICHSGDIAHENVWWLGFDCAHCDDVTPSTNHRFDWGVYRNLHYVRSEVSSLAKQLAA